QVTGNRIFNTFFAGLLGFGQLSVNAGSAAYVNKGACSSSGLFPVTINVSTFADINGDGIRDVHFEETEPNYTYQVFEKSSGTAEAPGNFAWITWNGDTAAQTLADNIAHPSNSGVWHVGDSVPASTGAMNNTDVRNNTQWYI